MHILNWFLIKYNDTLDLFLNNLNEIDAMTYVNLLILNHF